MRCSIAVLCFLVACSSKPKTPTTGGGSTAGGSDETPPADDDPTKCEKGRCLEDISAIVISNRPAARACYDNRKLTVEGKVIINFSIDPEGTVVDASQGMQDGQLEDAELVTCIADVIKQLKFAKSSRGKTTRAYHRFDFSPK